MEIERKGKWVFGGKMKEEHPRRLQVDSWFIL